MINALVSAVIAGFFEGLGYLLFCLFGKRPHSVVMIFTGMAFCIAVGMVMYKAFH
jgi:hypothetical protein